MRLRRYTRQWLNIVLCVIFAVLCCVADNRVVTIVLWAIVAAINLEWVYTLANRAHLRRMGGWMKW